MTNATHAYVDDDGRIVATLTLEDGSIAEDRAACSAPAGTDLVSLDCDGEVGDLVLVTPDGRAIGRVQE